MRDELQPWVSKSRGTTRTHYVVYMTTEERIIHSTWNIHTKRLPTKSHPRAVKEYILYTQGEPLASYRTKKQLTNLIWLTWMHGEWQSWLCQRLDQVRRGHSATWWKTCSSRHTLRERITNYTKNPHFMTNTTFELPVFRECKGQEPREMYGME